MSLLIYSKPFTNVFAQITKPKIISCLCILSRNISDVATTVDNVEVIKHSKLMSEWWETRGPMKALHAMNEIRVPFIRDGLKHIPKNERTTTPLQGFKILDVGCGGGILSEPLARLGADVTGLDASKELIELASDHKALDDKLAGSCLKYVNATIEEHAENHQNNYDAVVASEIMEHVTNKELFVNSCIKSLKPGGKVFFTTPNKTQLSRFFGIWLAENVMKMVPRGTHDYDKFTTPPELSFLLERNNCHVECLYGCMYSFLNNKWFFIESTNFLFALQAVKLREAKV